MSPYLGCGNPRCRLTPLVSTFVLLLHKYLLTSPFLQLANGTLLHPGCSLLTRTAFWKPGRRLNNQDTAQEEGCATGSQIFTVLRVLNENILIQSPESQALSQCFGFGGCFPPFSVFSKPIEKFQCQGSLAWADRTASCKSLTATLHLHKK